MSLASVSPLKLKSSGRKRFIEKILRRRLLLTSASMTSDSLKYSVRSEGDLSGASGSPISKRLLQILGRASLDSDAFMDEDVDSIYYHDSVTEAESHDIMLDPSADIFSNDSVERFAQKNEKVEFPTLNSSTAGREESELPWAGLTYEALVFPKYFKANKKSNKSPRVLNNIFLAQELRCSQAEIVDSNGESDDDACLPDEKPSILDESSEPMNPNEILVMEFSRDGKYLAVAGRDTRITVWQVISSPLSRLQYKDYEAEKDHGKPSSKRKSNVYRCAPVFHLDPVKVFEGHTSTILSLDWSKNNFLVSGSMDRTVKLWNIERDECLETFQHDDFVTAVAFHPNDDRFLISGSLDNCVRLWSILDCTVPYMKNLGDDVLITALAFTPVGNYCVVGGFNGSLFALETNGLHFVHRIEVKENTLAHPFHHKRNSKITGIRVFENEAATDVPQTQLQKWSILVTTNDSKVRLIDLRLRKLVTRFKGSSNNSSSIVASLSGDNRYIISGSEDHWCYVWENNNSIINNKLRLAMKDFYVEGKTHMSEKHKKMSKLFHDNKLWKKFNMQNFLEESDGHTYVANENNSYTAFHPHHSKVNVALFAPEATKKLLEFSDDIIYDLVKRGPSLVNAGIVSSRHKKINFAHSTGLDCGHIIITCDTTGLIRVFRQDSAYHVRKGLVEFRKSYKNSKIPENCDVQSGLNNNLMMDLGGFNKRSIKARSLSPPFERSSGSFKSKFQNRLRQNSRGNNATPPNSLLAPIQSSSKSIPITDSPELGFNTVSSSSQVNLRDTSKIIPRTKDHRVNYITISSHDEDYASPSDESTTYTFSVPDKTHLSASDVPIVRNGRPRRTSSISAEYPYGSIPSIVEQEFTKHRQKD